MKKLISKKFFTVLMTIAFNLYFVFAGQELPLGLQQEVLVLVNALVAVYVSVQALVDRSK